MGMPEAGLETPNQKAVESQAAGKAYILRISQHSNEGFFHCGLKTASQIRPHSGRESLHLLNPALLVKSRAEAPVGESISVEINASESRPSRIGSAEDFSKDRQVSRLSRGGQPLHFVLVGARFETEKIGDPVEKVAQRIREIELTHGRQLVSLRLEEYGGSIVARTIGAEDIRFLE